MPARCFAKLFALIAYNKDLCDPDDGIRKIDAENGVVTTVSGKYFKIKDFYTVVAKPNWRSRKSTEIKF